eukprot:363745-Chlamydomonas_euryale.AAC.4
MSSTSCAHLMSVAWRERGREGGRGPGREEQREGAKKGEAKEGGKQEGRREWFNKGGRAAGQRREWDKAHRVAHLCMHPVVARVDREGKPVQVRRQTAQTLCVQQPRVGDSCGYEALRRSSAGRSDHAH